MGTRKLGEGRMNVIIVGHIDHGKSTLIGRLVYDTGSLPEERIREIERISQELGHKLEFAFILDALEEERKGMMTIETTQTFFKTEKREYAIIDAPGHKEFIKNMVTGASQADAAILVVDAKEGVKEQTKRHAYFLKLLGIPKVIVAINKMDLVGYEEKPFENVKEDIVSYLKGIDLSPEFVIPVSAYNGDNVVKNSERMPWYEGPTVTQALDSLERVTPFFDFRFPVQDEYEINGEKVYVGNILSGSVKEGEIVKCYPEGYEVTVNKILNATYAKAPAAIGIATDKPLKRGYILGKGSEPLVTKNISSLVFCLSGNLKKGESYTLRCVTQEVKCKIKEITERIDVETLEKTTQIDELKEVEIGKVELELEKPAVFEKFNTLKELGRFVLLERGKIIAGGIVTNGVKEHDSHFRL